MKEFQVLAGLTEDHMTEILSSGLKNDAIPETFSVKHTNTAGIPFPTRYIKIVPISCVLWPSYSVVLRCYVLQCPRTEFSHVDMARIDDRYN